MGYCSWLIVKVTVNCMGCFWQSKFIALVVTLMLTGALGYSNGLNCDFVTFVDILFIRVLLIVGLHECTYCHQERLYKNGWLE